MWEEAVQDLKLHQLGPAGKGGHNCRSFGPERNKITWRLRVSGPSSAWGVNNKVQLLEGWGKIHKSTKQ